MDNFGTVIEKHLRHLTGMLGHVPVAGSAPVLARLRGDDVIGVIEATTGAIRELEALRTVAVGVVAERSTRDAGQNGLAQKHGHRSAVSLVQDATGTSRQQASKAVKLGRSLVGSAPTDGGDGGERGETDGVPPSAGPGEGSRGAASDGAVTRWHQCLGDAFTAGRITLDQQSAIRRGLGDPPTTDDARSTGDAQAAGSVGPLVDAETAAAWAAAALHLIDEAPRRTVEDLGAAARNIRDHLDPEGATRRFDERFERRTFRLWTDRDGIRHGSFTFEDHGAAWITAVIDAALRPRRGGPRFVDPDERADAEALVTDPRSNDQLTYDLVLDVLRTGTLADAATVLGTRQAGVRIVVTDAASTNNESAVAVVEDTGTTVPATFATQHTCDTGAVTCTTDRRGNPLNLGRETRLFTPRQRVALAVRDGGCCWPGCDRPPSYCEAHHIDRFSEGGRTDVDRGILLCRFHHMNIHHHGWRITRDGAGPFVLYSPDPTAAPHELRRRLERRYAFGDLRPPSRRFRPAA